MGEGEDRLTNRWDRLTSRTAVRHGFRVLITIILEPEARVCGRWFRFWFYPYGDWSLTGCIVSGIETLYESLAGTFKIKDRKLDRPRKSSWP